MLATTSSDEYGLLMYVQCCKLLQIHQTASAATQSASSHGDAIETTITISTAQRTGFNTSESNSNSNPAAAAIVNDCSIIVDRRRVATPESSTAVPRQCQRNASDGTPHDNLSSFVQTVMTVVEAAEHQ